MSAEDIAEARAALLGSLPSKVVNRWKEGGAKWGKDQPKRKPISEAETNLNAPAEVQVVEPAAAEEAMEDEEENDELHQSKMEWTKPVTATKPMKASDPMAEPPHQRPFLGEATKAELKMPHARFGLKGELMERKASAQQEDYLHHHGDEPDRAGWVWAVSISTVHHWQTFVDTSTLCQHWRPLS